MSSTKIYYNLVGPLFTFKTVRGQESTSNYVLCNHTNSVTFVLTLLFVDLETEGPGVQRVGLNDPGK